MFLSRFLKGLSLALSFALMLTIFSGSQAYAQSEDVECSCADYEQSYLEYKTAFQMEQGLFDQVVDANDPGALLEYLSTNNLQTAFENFIMGKSNLEDCQKRVEQNQEMCLETSLTETERGSLMENTGRASLGDYKTVEQLTRFFMEDLSIPDHQAEFTLMTGANMETNIQKVIDYLIQEHVLEALMNNENIKKALREAAMEHLKGRGFVQTGAELTKEELIYLKENTGRALLDSYDTYPKLEDFFLQDLKDHAEVVGEDFDAAEIYMKEQHNLGAAPDQIKNAMLRALKKYLEGLGIIVKVVPALPCPDCTKLERDVKAKQTELDNANTRLTNALTSQGAAVDALSQYETDLTNAINGSCEEVADYKAVNVTSGQASGIIMGHHFHCKSEAEIEDMLQKLKDFRSSHQKKAKLEEDLKNANRDIANAKRDIAKLTGELKRLQNALADCKRKQKVIPNCPAAAPVNPKPDTGAVAGNPSDESNIGSGVDVEAMRKELNIPVSTFIYEPTAINKVVDFRNTNKARLRALHTKFNTKFDAIQNRVNTSGFSDYAKLDTRGRESVEYLTNRIPLFKGEEGGKRFGEDEILSRAVVAEILYRLAELGGVEYSTDIAGVAQPSDVPADVWFEKSVKAAIKNGVFIPQDNKVRPGDEVNWAELVTILRRFYGLEAINPEVPTFRNVNANEWYTGEFETLVEAEILTRADFALDNAPWKNLTKLEFAKVIHNALGAKASFLE
jgi:hypothetical protein